MTITQISTLENNAASSARPVRLSSAARAVVKQDALDVSTNAVSHVVHAVFFR